MMLTCIEDSITTQKTSKGWSRADSTSTHSENLGITIRDTKQFFILIKKQTKPNEVETHSVLFGQYTGTGDIVTPKTVAPKVSLNNDDLLIKNPADQLNDLKTNMGLNLCDISSILGVSRQTIYSWLEGTVAVRNQYKIKLNNLDKICKYWSSKNIGPLGSYLRCQISPFDSSLFDLLQNETVNVNTIYKILDVIENKLNIKSDRLKSKKNKFQEHGFDDIDEAKRDKNLDKLTRKIS